MVTFSVVGPYEPSMRGALFIAAPFQVPSRLLKGPVRESLQIHLRLGLAVAARGVFRDSGNNEAHRLASLDIQIQSVGLDRSLLWKILRPGPVENRYTIPPIDLVCL
jgi:hypothetical protein